MIKLIHPVAGALAIATIGTFDGTQRAVRVPSTLKRFPRPTAPRRSHDPLEERAMSWKWKPSWYILGGKASIVQPALQCLVTKRSTVLKIDGRRAPKRAQPDLVLDLIRTAANALLHLRPRKVHRSRFSEPKGNPRKAKGEAPLQTSAEVVRTYSAVVNALTAAILNAEAALNWLGTQPPDLEEARRALSTIAKDGKRAGEIIARLRAPMQDDALDP
ncbi:hypothetical protein ACVW1C_002279 [Bradyrhizobium sp. USDA 4011]